MQQLIRLMARGFLLGLVSCGTQPSPAGGRADDLAFLPATPEKGRIFALYNYHGPAIRRNNWTSRFDLSGISWNDCRAATAISRDHVVMAAHFIRPSSVPLIFHDRDGSKHERTITRVISLSGAGDIAVAKLNQPLPAGVKSYRLAGIADAAPMKLALVTDQTMTVSLHRIGFAGDGRVILGYDPKIPKTYNRNLIAGDSGHPAFVLHDGEPVLLTTFTTGGPGTGPYYGDPAIQRAVADAMAKLH
jgi:hypothetical protein